ncbi:MAG: DNA polymerase III subunit delta [Eubacterium sp.]|nr:DNA polymerase III subunit delta [Eubacterium sp.]MDY5497671.1 DNA polymerase III subunit delta [Anaerobutyricum sp.]
MKEIKRQIKEKDFPKVYLLTGDEPYLIIQARHLLKDAMVRDGDEMNFTLFTESKIDLNALRETAFTYPFFSEKRLIVLDGTGILKTGKDEFVRIMEEMPDSTCILICEAEVDKRSKVYKWIKKNGYIGEFLKKNQKEKTLLSWIAALLGKENKNIRESDARYFLEKTGDDMFQIKNETEKLISYLGDRTEITREDIDNITSGEVQDKIFELTASIARGEKKEALSYYNDLILLKEPPLHILYLIVRQYRILLIIASMRNLHKPDDAIAKAAGIPRFAIRKNEQQLKGYSMKTLEMCLEQCIEIEEEIKTGKMEDRIGLELLITGLSDKIIE